MKDVPKTIPLGDFDAAAQLLGGLPVMSTDPVERRRYLLEGLARIVGADCWVWVVQHFTSTAPAYYALIEGGWQNDQQKLGCLLSALSPEGEFLFHPIASRPADHLTYTRRDLIGDSDWYRSDFYRKHREPLGLDDILLSVYPLSRRVQSVIRLHRTAGRAAFGEAERRLAHVMTGSVDWLHRAGVPVDSLPELNDLPRRAREVLLLLLQGHARKRIAHELNISEHTVADYTKILHRQFQVRTRGELLARFIPPSLLAHEGN